MIKTVFIIGIWFSSIGMYNYFPDIVFVKKESCEKVMHKLTLSKDHKTICQEFRLKND